MKTKIKIDVIKINIFEIFIYITCKQFKFALDETHSVSCFVQLQLFVLYNSLKIML